MAARIYEAMCLEALQATSHGKNGENLRGTQTTTGIFEDGTTSQLWISGLVLHESMSSKILCYLCQCSIELLLSWPFLHLYSRKRWVASLFMAIPIDHNKIIIWLVVQVCPFDKTGEESIQKYETNENSIHIEAMCFSFCGNFKRWFENLSPQNQLSSLR